MKKEYFKIWSVADQCYVDCYYDHGNRRCRSKIFYKDAGFTICKTCTASSDRKFSADWVIVNSKFHEKIIKVLYEGK